MPFPIQLPNFVVVKVIYLLLSQKDDIERINVLDAEKYTGGDSKLTSILWDVVLSGDICKKLYEKSGNTAVS